MICPECSREFDGEDEKMCGICRQEMKPDILENSMRALEELQKHLAISKNGIRICAHDFGELDPQVGKTLKLAYLEIGTLLADVRETINVVSFLLKNREK